jgi:hypothetical protein
MQDRMTEDEFFIHCLMVFGVPVEVMTYTYLIEAGVLDRYFEMNTELFGYIRFSFSDFIHWCSEKKQCDSSST